MSLCYLFKTFFHTSYTPHWLRMRGPPWMHRGAGGLRSVCVRTGATGPAVNAAPGTTRLKSPALMSQGDESPSPFRLQSGVHGDEASITAMGRSGLSVFIKCYFSSFSPWSCISFTSSAENSLHGPSGIFISLSFGVIETAVVFPNPFSSVSRTRPGTFS